MEHYFKMLVTFSVLSGLASIANGQASPVVRLPDGRISQKAAEFDAAEARIKEKFAVAVRRFRDTPNAKPTPIAVSWRFDVPHALKRENLLPADGIVRDQATMTRLWRAWKPEGVVPTVDFQHYAVCAVHGIGSKLRLFHKMFGNGHIELEFAESDLVKKYDSTVFAFVVPLDKARSFNGVPLIKESKREQITSEALTSPWRTEGVDRE